MGLMIVVLCAAIALGWYVRRGQRGGSRRNWFSQAHHDEPYACVSILFEDTACAAVKSIAGVRFLRKLAPLLPLNDCDCLACTCRYRHFPDRRHYERREVYSRAKDVEVPERRINRMDRRRKVLRA